MGSISPSFDLWVKPWIPVLNPDGSVTEVGIRDVLVHAHETIAIHETSPPLAAGLQRLLIAIAQACHDTPEQPLSPHELGELLARGQFDPTVIDEFGACYGDRFELFSPHAPFMQSADIPLQRRAQDKPVSVGYLLPEEPTGTNVTHFRHRYEEEHRFCPPCAARALVAVAAFAAAAGRGFRPSINGVPPLYVFPAGESLFRSLVLSLMTPRYRPKEAAPDEQDQPWWERNPANVPSTEVTSVGYLESLTFPARRVRLYPEVSALEQPCTRCARETILAVSIMHFSMGLSRPRDAAPWFDPFAAYRTRDKRPVPLRPSAGKALWREYGTLFVTHTDGSSGISPPAVVRQLGALADAEVGALRGDEHLSFRCVGLRTDMKAKVFEWTDETLEHGPAGLLTSPEAQRLLTNALDAAERGFDVLSRAFGKWLAPPQPGVPVQKDRARNAPVRQQMRDSYWQSLAGPFRDLTGALAQEETRDSSYQAWLRQVRSAGMAAITLAADAIGDDAADLRRRVGAVAECRRNLSGLLRRQFGYDGNGVNDRRETRAG